MTWKYFFVMCFFSFSNSLVNGYLELDTGTDAFDQDLYQDVLNDEQCRAQLNYVSSNTLLMAQFLDAGIRTPKSILLGNLVDQGSYYQCLGISHDSGDEVIGGKYCSITIPLEQDVQWPAMRSELQESIVKAQEIDEEMRSKLRAYEMKRRALAMLSGDVERFSEGSVASSIALTLAVCIPRPCTTRLALDSLLLNLTASGLTYTENYCRLTNDKPWVTADTVASVVFGVLGLLTILSTCYDIKQNVLHKKDPKTVNPIYQSFSVYTNTRNLVTYKSTPKTIECLDGIRVLAMIWIIIGHTFSTQLQSLLLNPLDAVEWLDSLHSIWITAAPISVDTFFLLSGVLLVYTSAGKFSRSNFVKNIHLFYLNRLLRMFPILAAGCLLQASWFNHIADGPFWQPFARNVNSCRTWWWTTLLHVQNYVGDMQICLGHTWYLAVDTQIHILSPLILFWVFTSRRAAWVSITGALAALLTASTIFNAVRGFSFAVVNAGRLFENDIDFMRNYYLSTFTRASPLVVGMLYGYLLVVSRENKIRMKRSTVVMFWSLSLATLATVIYITYPTQRANWTVGVWDVVFNSFLRPVWAAALGWLIFACANGYGGPLNWMLSLSVWKIPSKLSYGMYIFHYPLIIAMNCTAVQSPYFSDSYMVFRFFSDLVLAISVSFLVTVLVDSPFSTLIRIALMGRAKKSPIPQPIPNMNSNGKPISYHIDPDESKTSL